MACYVVTPQDREVAKMVEGWDGTDVARLRGMYEKEYKKALDISDALKAAKILAGLRKKLMQSSYRAATTNLVESFRELRGTMSSERRQNRVRMLATEFSRAIDKVQIENPSLSREQIANGVETPDGVIQYGEMYLFNQVFQDLRNRFKVCHKKGLEDKANRYKQILDNFDALCAYARVALRDTEGLRLGGNREFAAKSLPSDFGENDLEDLSAWFDPSENTKEAWQQSYEVTSAFSSLTDAVRRVLSTLHARDEKGEILRDDLGYEVFLNPIEAHQILASTLFTIQDEDDIIPTLEQSGLSFAKELIQVLDKNPQVRTQLFGDFYKNHQLYGGVTYEQQKDGTIKTKTSILNKVRNLLTGLYSTRISLGKQLSEDSVYNADGSVNWANVQALRQYIKEIFFPITATENVFEKTDLRNSAFGRASFTARANMLMHVTRALGIELDVETATRIAKSRGLFTSKREGLLRNIRELVLSSDGKSPAGIDALLTQEDIRALERGDYSALSRKEKSFKKLLKAKTAFQQQTGSKEGAIEEKVNRILNAIATQKDAFKVENRVTFRDKKGKSKTMYSLVAPSYMGDLIEKINAYATSEQGLQAISQFITDKYLDSSMFVDENGNILNRWMYDLIHDLELAQQNPKLRGKTLAENMSYHRFIGDYSGNAMSDFEDFTEKQHALQMMHEFFFADNLTDVEGRKYANYPVFILGDSGVSKFIRAKRYSAQDILDGMYNIYLSEVQRNRLAAAANKDLESKGYKPIDNLSSTGFKMLPFLMDSQYRPEGADADATNWTEAQVKEAIRHYMKDAVAKFKTQLGGLGLLEKTTPKDGTSQYKYWNDVMGEYRGKTEKGEVDMSAQATEAAFDKMLADYYWNTKFATLQQFQMMTIDVAFYKDTKDLQKRYKEIHAPGRVASIKARDFEGRLYAASKWGDGVESVAYFDDPKINAEISNPDFMGAMLYQYALPDKKQEAEQAIKDGIIKPQPKGSHEEAERQAKLQELLGENYGLYTDYTKNVLADGQGYRTLRSYRKIMGMLGKWSREHEDTYNRIQGLTAQYGPEEDIPATVIDELHQLATIFQPIKPYMFTVEKYKMNDNGGTLNIPVQHKYAEAVLIPQLLPKGSMARHLAEWMDENEVDMVGAWSKGGDKIVKVGGFGSAPIEGTTNREELMSAMGKAYIHKFNYADYREQTNVPEHINVSRLFGTQLRKIIMSYVNMAKDYSGYVDGQIVNIMGQMVKLEGTNLINFYNSLIVANILDSYNGLEKDIQNPEKLAAILQQSIINNSRQSLDNLLAFALEGDGFAMPLFEGGMEHDTAALLMSIFKDRVNKQKIQGGAAVQVSAMGITGYEVASDLRCVTSEDGKNILYSEIEVPWDLTVNMWNADKGKYEAVELKYSDFVNDDHTLKTDKDGKPLIEKKFPGILDRVLYRIPTEKEYSMINAHIVRFSPKTAGGTIKVPAQLTTQAGFDFDIDKLYYLMREFYCKPNKFADVLGEALASQEKTREIGEAILSVIDDPLEYDLTKSCLEQDEDPIVARALRNNMILTLVQKRLEDPETFKNRTRPGGFVNPSMAARVIRELQFGKEEGITKDGEIDFDALERRAEDKASDPEPNYDPSDPFTIITYNQMNQVAGKLIGIFANQNANHAFASLMKEFKLKRPISFCGRHYTDLLHAPDGTNPSLNIAEYLSASVDAVKDPVLNYLNYNTITADAGAMLARLGYTGLEIGLLFNQKSIKDACELSYNENIPIETAIAKLTETYEKALQDAGMRTDSKTSEDVVSKQSLAKMLIEARKGKEDGKDMSLSYVAKQLQVLNLFSEILIAAGEVSEFVLSTKFTASNSVGSTFGEMYAQQMKVANYIQSLPKKGRRFDSKVTEGIQSPISNQYNINADDESYMKSLLIDGLGNPFAYEQCMYDMNKRFVRLMAKYFPYETPAYKNARNEAAAISKYGTLDAGTINDIHSEMMSYMLSQQDGFFNGEAMHIDPAHPEDVMTQREYYLEEFPRRVAKLLVEDPELKKQYTIFDYMVVDTHEVRRGLDTIEMTDLTIQEVGGLQGRQKDAIRDSWADLANDIPDLARDLFLYCYYKSGFEFSPKSFTHLAPVTVKERMEVDRAGMTYKQFLDKVLKGNIAVNTFRFLREFVINHADNYRFVYSAKSGRAGTEVDKIVREKAIQGGRIAQSFTITAESLGENAQLFVPKSLEGEHTEWIPAIRVGNSLFIASNTDTSRFNVSTADNDAMTYTYVGEVDGTRVIRRVDRQTPQESSPAPIIEKSVDHSQPVADKPKKVSINSLDFRTIANAVARAMASAGEIMAEEVRGLSDHLFGVLNSSSEEELNAFKQEALANYKNLKDDEGNLIC